MTTTCKNNTAKYRMVAFDLDGTLLGPTHQISKVAVNYLRDLHNKGFIISIATGRSPAAISEVIRRLNFEFPKPHSKCFPIVSTNGAKGLHVHHDSFYDDDEVLLDEESKGNDLDLKWENNPMVNGKMQVTELFHQPVLTEVALKVLQLSKDIGCVTNYYVNHDVYAQATKPWHYNMTNKYTQLTGVKFTYCNDDYKEAMDIGLPSKLLVLCLPDDIDVVYEKVKKEIGQDAHVIRGSPPFFVEVLNKDVCKGNGLELLCQALGVGIDECIAFGDGDNDIEFIEKAGLGIAMKNARDTLKVVSDEITELTNCDDGAIKTLQRLESEDKLIFTA